MITMSISYKCTNLLFFHLVVPAEVNILIFPIPNATEQVNGEPHDAIFLEIGDVYNVLCEFSALGNPVGELFTVFTPFLPNGENVPSSINMTVNNNSLVNYIADLPSFVQCAVVIGNFTFLSDVVLVASE